MAAILIIEDDDDIREILAEMLSDRGYAVNTACNGLDGLEQMRSALPCVVLLDLMMPVMDGWEVRREMLADPALATIPVVVVSGVADVEEKSAVLKADQVLTKPVRWPMLLASVRAHCQV